MSVRSTHRPSARRTSVRARAAAAAVALTTVAASLMAGAGDAGAATKVYPLHDCINISPNIVDLPYMPTRAMVSEYANTTYIQIDYSSYWLGIGYDSAARLDWHNLKTGKKGTLVDNSRVRPPYPGVHNFSINRGAFGPGEVKLTLSSVNRNALWAIPARSCSGTVIAP